MSSRSSGAGSTSAAPPATAPAGPSTAGGCVGNMSTSSRQLGAGGNCASPPMPSGVAPSRPSLGRASCSPYAYTTCAPLACDCTRGAVRIGSGTQARFVPPGPSVIHSSSIARTRARCCARRPSPARRVARPAPFPEGARMMMKEAARKPPSRVTNSLRVDPSQRADARRRRRWWTASVAPRVSFSTRALRSRGRRASAGRRARTALSHMWASPPRTRPREIPRPYTR